MSALIAIVDNEPDVVELGKAGTCVKNVRGIGYKLKK
jgi:hypothetical protein